MNGDTGSRAGRVETYLERCLRVLELVAADPGPVTLAEIGARADMPVTTVHRVVHALLDSGAVERDGRRYRIGRRLTIIAGHEGADASDTA